MAEINKVNNYKTVYRGGTAEIVEKKSRFIAHSAHVESEEEALAFIEQIKKQYWDARHNCHAFSVGVTNETARCSDDGEPAQDGGQTDAGCFDGAAAEEYSCCGDPIFWRHTACTGGSCQSIFCGCSGRIEGKSYNREVSLPQVRMSMDYTMLGKMQYLAAKLNLMILDTLYTEGVEMQLLVPDTQYAAFIKEVTEASNGKVVPESEGLCYGADVEGKIEIFDA